MIAATVMYQYAQKLMSVTGQLTAIQSTERVTESAQALLTTLNALSLVHSNHAWIKIARDPKTLLHGVIISN